MRARQAFSADALVELWVSLDVATTILVDSNNQDILEALRAGEAQTAALTRKLFAEECITLNVPTLKNPLNVRLNNVLPSGTMSVVVRWCNDCQARQEYERFARAFFTKSSAYLMAEHTGNGKVEADKALRNLIQEFEKLEKRAT
jgi:hypothetical protein